MNQNMEQYEERSSKYISNNKHDKREGANTKGKPKTAVVIDRFIIKANHLIRIA